MRLLNKSFRPFLIFTLFAVAISIPLFYWVVQAIYIRDADESLLISKKQIQIKLNQLSSDQATQDSLISIINQLEIGYQLTPLLQDTPVNSDRYFSEEKFDAAHGHVEPFRVLETFIEVRGILFKRFSTTNSRGGQGGLGLAIVKEICTQNKWQVAYAFEKENHVFWVIF